MVRVVLEAAVSFTGAALNMLGQSCVRLAKASGGLGDQRASGSRASVRPARCSSSASLARRSSRWYQAWPYNPRRPLASAPNAHAERPAGASIASPGPLERVVRQSTPHAAPGIRFLVITHSQLTEQIASPHGRDRPRKVELHPGRASLDVGPAPTPCEQVKVEEWLGAHVEDARPLLDDASPGPQVGEQVGEVIEQLWRTVRHGSVFRALRKASSVQPDQWVRATSCAPQRP